MKIKIITLPLLSGVMLAGSPLNTQAATTYMESHNGGMGGTGVASSRYGTAALANPALIS